ncbi:hypothetical protein [Jatrophihabitans sp.]|uniref:hypothetical protein n=1 Tax=Jatrophihabitans sp. TaxID=1932789 RepID=UPI002B5A6FEA|nr:hypothetical protein [Jatrophihabitans sp.]
MGKSPSIQDLEARDREFANYLKGMRDELNARADAMDQSLGDQIARWKAGTPDARILVSGRNLDFVHEPSFFFGQLLNGLQAVAGAVFAGTGAPAGTTVEGAAQKEVKEVLGSAVEQPAAVELLIAGKVFDVLGNVIYDFGTTASGTFSSGITSKYLDLGMQMFVGVSEQAYNSESFFSNETIYEYVYTYQVFCSLKELKQVTEQTIGRGLANQITEFEHKMQRLPIPDDPMSDPGAKYDALMKWYRDHIVAIEAQLRQWGH